MSWTRELRALIRRLVRAETARIRTHFPAQVEAYDAATNTCKLQPCIKALRTEDPNNRTTIDLPILEDVPVEQRGSGKLLFSLAPQVGSYGWCHVSDRCLEQWILNGGVVDPGSGRRFDISDVWFSPGAYPLMPDGDNGLLAVPVATDRISLRTRAGTTEISVLDDDNIHVETTGDVTVEAVGDVTVEAAGDVNVESTAGDVNLTGPSHAAAVKSAAVEVDNGSDFVALGTPVTSMWTTLQNVLTAWTAPKTPDGGVALAAAIMGALSGAGHVPPSVSSTNLKAD